TLVFFVVVAAGLFQALFGALRLGGLIRYIPSPVMAGFQNAVAVLIILAQVDTMLGFRRHVSVGRLPSHLALIPPLTLAVALLTLGVGAFGLAIVSSLDALLCIRLMDGVTGGRSRGSRELVRIGVGNMAAACFGGIASGVNLGASLANHRAGGRTRLASMAAAVVVLLAVLLLGPAIAVLPRVVIAGMLFVVGVQLFDQWSLRLLVRTITG